MEPDDEPTTMQDPRPAVSLADCLRGLMNLLLGTAKYLVRRRREAFVVMGIIPLHARTNGRASRALNWIVTTLERPLDERSWTRPTQPTRVIAGREDEAVAALRADGIALLPSGVDADLCRQLVDEVRDLECEALDEVGRTFREVYRPETRKEGCQYRIPTDAILRSPVVQQLLADPFLLDVGHEYLRAVPVLAQIDMWWSTARPEGESSYLAQKFHWDMPGLQWLKVFLYLTDVDEASGPHVFVRGSHRTRPEGAELIGRGGVRVEDDEIERAYGADRVQTICGDVGTLFVADTRGFHKGLAPRRHDRLLLQLVFNNSLLGIDRFDLPITDPSDELRDAMRARPRSFIRTRLVTSR